MSSQAPLLPARAPIAQPDPQSTGKDQKGFQLSSTYNAQEVNSEFDRVHKRINDILAEGAALPDLATAGSTANADICTRINALAALMRQAGLLKSS